MILQLVIPLWIMEQHHNHAYSHQKSKSRAALSPVHSNETPYYPSPQHKVSIYDSNNKKPIDLNVNDILCCGGGKEEITDILEDNKGPKRTNGSQHISQYRLCMLCSVFVRMFVDCVLYKRFIFCIGDTFSLFLFMTQFH